MGAVELQFVIIAIYGALCWLYKIYFLACFLKIYQTLLQNFKAAYMYIMRRAKIAETVYIYIYTRRGNFYIKRIFPAPFSGIIET